VSSGIPIAPFRFTRYLLPSDMNMYASPLFVVAVEFPSLYFFSPSFSLCCDCLACGPAASCPPISLPKCHPRPLAGKVPRLFPLSVNLRVPVFPIFFPVCSSPSFSIGPIPQQGRRFLSIPLFPPRSRPRAPFPSAILNPLRFRLFLFRVPPPLGGFLVYPMNCIFPGGGLHLLPLPGHLLFSDCSEQFPSGLLFGRSPALPRISVRIFAISALLSSLQDVGFLKPAHLLFSFPILGTLVSQFPPPRRGLAVVLQYSRFFLPPTDSHLQHNSLFLFLFYVEVFAPAGGPSPLPCRLRVLGV